jgi:type I restriction enzyme S subunit
MYGGTKQGLSLDDVKNYVILLPPTHEQDELVERIETECRDIEHGAATAKREIALLREYRTRLIADVVTGKLDVREAAARLPDEVEDVEPLEEAEADADVEALNAEDEAVVEEAEA